MKCSEREAPFLSSCRHVHYARPALFLARLSIHFTATATETYSVKLNNTTWRLKRSERLMCKMTAGLSLLQVGKEVG